MQLKSILTVLSVVSACYSDLINEIPSNDHILECFKVIHRQIFANDDAITVWPRKIIDYTFFQELYTNNHSLLVQEGISNTIGNIYETDNLEEFQWILSSSQRQKLLMVSTLPLADMEVVLKEYYANEVIIIRLENESSSFVLYKGCKTSGLLINDKCSQSNFLQKYQVFNKHPTLKGCFFQVQTVIWPPYVLPSSKATFSNGLEILIMNTLAQYQQFSIEYNVCDQHNLEHNHQIGIGSYYATNELHMKYDTVAYHLQESFTWCVPFVSIQTHTNVFLTMQAHVWVSLQIVHFAVSTAIWLLSVNAPNESTSFKTYKSVLQNIVATMLNITINVQPRTFKVRFLFMLYVIFTLHVNVAYESALFSVLTKPKQEQKISSVDHITHAKFKLYYIPGTLQYLGMDPTSDRWEACYNGTSCISKAATAKDFALFVPYLHMNYILNYDNNVNLSVYCFEDHQILVPIEMILKKGFPFEHHFQKFVYNIVESGIVGKWQQDIFYDRRIMVTEEMPVIKISHLTFLFGYVLVLWTFAFIFFLLEVYLHKKILECIVSSFTNNFASTYLQKLVDVIDSQCC
ncbi:hypothetical protein RI129_001369 [Pyrocoelia pectoralis]|uniref:Ionotropic glutamate receptor C-terminal domain-containing protein n=1 Tax=Pyrocoelia pectoralis TaxID=417401 RepID=A0AAN7VMU2_9COLE